MREATRKWRREGEKKNVCRSDRGKEETTERGRDKEYMRHICVAVREAKRKRRREGETRKERGRGKEHVQQ